MNWTPDNDLLNQTIELGLECARELQETFHSESIPNADSDVMESLLLLCQAAGTLYYLGEEARAEALPVAGCAPVIHGTLAAWHGDELHRAYVDFLQLERQLPAATVPREGDDNGLRTSLFEEVVNCLRERDRVQLQWKGAWVLTKTEPTLSEDFQDILALFDDKVRDCLHFLIPMNVRRQNRVLWARPDRLVDFWWWEQGFEFPQDALRSFFTAAEILRQFPKARSFFESLCESSEQLDRLLRLTPETVQQAIHPSLRERLKPRSTPQDESPLQNLRLAAKSLSVGIHSFAIVQEKGVLLQNEHFSLIAGDDTLTVLLRAPYDAERDVFSFLPTAYIEVPGESRHILPQDEQHGVFATFSFSHPLFEQVQGTLWVQCMDLQVSLDLCTIERPDHAE